MKTIYLIIEKTSKKPLIFILLATLILLNILMNTPGLPTSTPSMQKISPAFTPFDLQAKGYSTESFTNDLNNLGEEGRNIYKNFLLLDILFPAIYALTFSSLIFLVFRKRNNWMKWLFVIPLLTGCADYIENTFIAISLVNYPSSNNVTVSLASFATQTKMVLNVLFVLSLVFTIGAWIVTLFQRKQA